MKLTEILSLVSLVATYASCQSLATVPVLSKELSGDFLSGQWFEVASYGRKTVPCACAQYRFEGQGGKLSIDSLCLSKQGQEIQRQGSLTFTNALRTQFKIETAKRSYGKFVADADLEGGRWLVLVDEDGRQASVLSRDVRLSLGDVVARSSFFANIDSSIFVPGNCQYHAKLQSHFRILQHLEDEVSATKIAKYMKEIKVSTPQDGRKCQKPVIQRAVLSDIVKKQSNDLPCAECHRPRLPGLIQPGCSFRLEPITSVTQKIGTRDLVFIAPEHETWTVEEVSSVTHVPLSPVVCKGRFKAISSTIVATSEVTKTVSRNVTDVDTQTNKRTVSFKGLIQPTCAFRLEPIVSVTQKSGTRDLIFQAPEHESWVVEEVSTVTNVPLGPVTCKGRFKEISKEIDTITEVTKTVSRNVTDVNAQTNKKTVTFKGLIPPTCSFRLEPIVSVTQIDGTRDLIFEAPEHETWTVQEITKVTSVPLGPIVCKGRFKAIPSGIIATSEVTKTVSRNITDVNTQSNNKTTTFKGLVPPVCTYRLEPVTSVSQKKGTHELIFEAPEHETWTVEEISKVSSVPLGPIICKGRFRDIPSDIMITSEVTKTVSRNVTDVNTQNKNKTVTFKGLVPPVCTYRLEPVTSVSQKKGTHELIFEAPEHETWTVQEVSKITSVPLGPIVCKGRFRDIPSNIQTTTEVTKTVSRNVTDVNTESSNKTTTFKGLVPPVCTYRLEPVTSVSQKKGTHELIFEAPEHETWTVQEVSKITATPLGPIVCKGRFRDIPSNIQTTTEVTKTVSRNITDVNTESSNKTVTFKGLVPPTCSFKLEPIVSVTQTDGTRNLIFEAPEHETWTVEEVSKVTSALLGPVVCKGRFRDIPSDIMITSEVTKTVSRNVTDVNTQNKNKTVTYKGLAPPVCSYRLEPITSVTQKSGTRDLIFEAPEHETWTIKEVSKVTTTPLGPVICQGRFARPKSEVPVTESTLTFPSIWQPLTPPLCESTLPGIAAFTFDNAKDETTISAPGHADIVILDQVPVSSETSTPVTAPAAAHEQALFVPEYFTESTSFGNSTSNPSTEETIPSDEFN